MSNANPDISIIDFATLLRDVLGFTDDEYTSLGYRKPGSRFRAAVLTPADAVAAAANASPTVDVYFGVNPVRGPVRKDLDRGKEADVTRLAALWADLDVKPGACRDLEHAHTIIDELSSMMGTRPSAIVCSGHGLQPYWRVPDGHIDGDVTAARALLRRWGRLVTVTAENYGARADSVFDLPRMLRVPGTFNNKVSR